MNKYKKITITINEDTLTECKKYCNDYKMPLSRFLSYAALKMIKGVNQDGK